MAAFSRLQLAAALIEYDNDDEDPDAPRVSAQESAIFAHLRRNNPRGPIATRTSDYLGVALPTETGSDGGRDSEPDRRSRASADALRNPFGRDSTYGDLDTKEDELEVDLASWGLDALIPKEKTSKRNKPKAGALPNPHPQVVRLGPSDPRRRPDGNRSASLGNIDMFGEGGAFLEAGSTASSRALGPRRHSIGDPLDAAGLDPPPSIAVRQRRASEHYPIERLPVTPPLHSVPFPSSSSVRSPSPLVDAQNVRPSHLRTTSTASMGSRMLQQAEEVPNPFEIRPPSPDRASRFDPKASRARTLSQGTLGTIGLQSQFLEDEDPRASRIIDPHGRTRTVSGGTLGTQMLLADDDGAASTYDAVPGRDRMYSRAELMRPKLLVMPSPLQSQSSPAVPQTSPSSRDGFLLSTDGRPMPPGSRPTGRRASSTMSLLETLGSPSEAPAASNLFTPNPRMSLTLSQLTFRNTLMVDGSRDVAYADIESRLKRATEDGEQILPEPEPEPEPVPTVVVDAPTDGTRPPGKLLGRSLIDDLEHRKAVMKGKQRTFTGDSRPSMMARSNLQRSSTLIDPESLKQRPLSTNLNGFGADLQRRNSKGKTLINFDDEIPGARNAPAGGNLNLHSPRAGGGGNARSVFGVDTLWERELVKLREIEEKERVEEEARKQREMEAEVRRGAMKKGRGKKRGKGDALELESPLPSATSQQSMGLSEAVDSPPVLPDIQKASTPRRPPPPPGDGDDDDDESESGSEASSVIQRRAAAKPTAEWHAGSSDEERGPVRTTGNGPRYPNKQKQRSAPHPAPESDSEEDLPLVATIGRAVERAVAAHSRLQADSDSDEEKPLSVLIDSGKLKSPSLTTPRAGSSFLAAPKPRGSEDSDEDDQPLGLRASRVMPSSSGMLAGSSAGGGDEDEDDKPLAFHPDQLRKTQYAAMQQQQFMMQAAQMQQSMYFGAPSMMGSGFFAPPMAPPMMMAAPPPMMAPAVNEAAKLNRVDEWRHHVAVEGEPPT
ncbi:hypothetical protein EIP91_001508 [Steccherinum ochraceum]|uniref:Uncharacterized protein n=1 Tax=Steccherinum ochraceum TaxID=92696 RepID=A0A4R0S110_9APHY|nr:hypothetical protein EIP91_001508 [Steccherinum ochraceum]